MFIKNSKLVLENEVLENGVLQIDNGKIVKIGTLAQIDIPENETVIDANGLYVGPGFVDIHTHGGGGYMFETDPEKAAEHFLAHGETSILATLYYDLSKKELCEAIERIKNAAKQKGAAEAITGIYMEGPYMNPKYGACPDKNQWRGEICKADYSPVVDAAGDFVKVWAIAPERDGLEPFIKYAKEVNPNVILSVGHSEANYSQIMSLKKYGIKLQTHSMNATASLSQWEGTRGCGPDETCMLEKDMYAELISDSQGIHVCSELQRLLLMVKGTDKVVLISDSFVNENTPPKGFEHITDLTFDANGSLCGSKLTLDVACKNIMHHTSSSIVDAFKMASLNPARVIGIDNEVGSIAVGKRANLVITDDSFSIKNVILNGKVVY